MGAVFYNLTPEELCDLMCGRPEEDEDDGEDDSQDRISHRGIYERGT